MGKRARLARQTHNAVVVLGVVEDRSAAIAPIKGMVAVTSQVSTRRAGHAAIVWADHEVRKRFLLPIPECPNCVSWHEALRIGFVPGDINCE